VTDEGRHVLEDVLDEAIGSSHGDKIRLADLLDEFGTRSFGPILVIAPIGSIPGLPIAIGAIIVLLAVQIIIGSEHAWMPKRLQETGFDRHKVEAWRARWHKWLERIDRVVRPRLGWAVGGWAQWLASFCLIFLSATMVPLELVPMAVTLPGIAILFFGIGITARDGLMMLIGFAVTLPSIWFTIAWWPWGSGWGG
jgi:hypothetical protein